jgi:hypothetical protein
MIKEGRDEIRNAFKNNPCIFIERRFVHYCILNLFNGFSLFIDEEVVSHCNRRLLQ